MTLRAMIVLFWRTRTAEPPFGGMATARAAAIAIACGIVAVVGGCGPSAGSDEADVKTAVKTYIRAAAERDGIAACRVFSDKMQRAVADAQSAATCPDAMVALGNQAVAAGLGDCVRNIEVTTVALEGDFARVKLADVRCPELDSAGGLESVLGNAVISLKREDTKWVVDDVQSAT